MKGASNSKERGQMHRLIGLWLVLIALALAATMAACDGGENGDNSPTAQPTGGESPTAQPTGGESPTAQPTGQATTSAACEALASLERYRYVSNMTLESPEEIVPEAEGQPTPAATLTRDFTGRFLFEYNIDASLVSPDRIAAEITAGVGEPFSAVIIGDQHWITSGGEWEEVGQQYVIPYQPLEICNALFPEIDLDQAQGEKETINGVEAQHYTLTDIPSGNSMALIFGAESDMDILFQSLDVELWVSEDDGWPVRMDIQTSGLYGDRRELKGHVQIELRDINDKDIKVEPPI
jgi:hypothetical protein